MYIILAYLSYIMNIMFHQGCLMTGCLNGGSCLFDERKDTFACSCSRQWSGEKCEMEGKSKLFLFLKYDRRRIL